MAKVAQHLCHVFFLVAAVVYVRNTGHQGQDFEVYWRAGRALLEGFALYEVGNPAMVFKYPPWIATLFVPIALVPLAYAKWVWGLVEVVVLAFVIKDLANRFGRAFVYPLAISFWGIWMVHTLDGQITLLLVAAALLAIRELEKGTGGVGVAVFALLSPIKIFTVLSLGFLRRMHFAGTWWLWVIALVAVLSAPVLGGMKTWNPLDVFSSWSAAASSGGSQFKGEKVRGRDNQGLPAVVLRIGSVPAKNTSADLWAFLALSFLFVPVWIACSTGDLKMPLFDQVAGWLALSAVLHPLAWFHLFVITFPLVCVVVKRSWSAPNQKLRYLSLLGVAMVSAFTEKTLGVFGHYLEMMSIKSLGVLLLMGLLVWIRGGARRPFVRTAIPRVQ